MPNLPVTDVPLIALQTIARMTVHEINDCLRHSDDGRFEGFGREGLRLSMDHPLGAGFLDLGTLLWMRMDAHTDRLDLVCLNAPGRAPGMTVWEPERAKTLWIGFSSATGIDLELTASVTRLTISTIDRLHATDLDKVLVHSGHRPDSGTDRLSVVSVDIRGLRSYRFAD